MRTASTFFSAFNHCHPLTRYQAKHTLPLDSVLAVGYIDVSAFPLSKGPHIALLKQAFSLIAHPSIRVGFAVFRIQSYTATGTKLIQFPN